jgi:gamma-glutamyl:cysteine ligase YbdK (ATP-grasp superfamily)
MPLVSCGAIIAKRASVGVDIQNEHFSQAERHRFAQRLDEGLRALDLLLKRQDFAIGERTLGAELELCLIDDNGRPLAISQEIVNEADTPSITPEMGCFDIELSTPPCKLAGNPFSCLRESMQGTVNRIRSLAAKHGGRAVPISILPTLRMDDFNESTITDLPRYRALAREMRSHRSEPAEIAIEGDDSLRFVSPDAVSMEAANTAYQVHVSTSPDEFADLFNAAMLLSGPVIAAAANSPTFLGRRLWHETRVALFKQAGDDRPLGPDADIRLPPRVNFGNGWVREGAHELFMESVALYRPYLAECGEEEDAVAMARAGKLPQLSELRLHHGTIWTWNRPVYDPSHGGGLRIELRALPAGPSYEDMLANSAFMIGAMIALRPRIRTLASELPFTLATRNFYASAQHGLDAELFWPTHSATSPRPVRARDLVLSLIPEAREGLRQSGVDSAEADHYLEIFERRVRSGQTGAVWQRRTLTQLEHRGLSREHALAALLERYIEGFDSLRPVHTWSLAEEDY